MTYAIKLSHVTKAFRDGASEKHPLPVLHDFTCAIEQGEFFIFVGPSGAGKSTILRIMSGLEEADRGKIEWGKGYIPGDVSFVFQQFALLPWLTVADNVELALLQSGMDARKRRRRVLDELKQFGLREFAEAHPRELSGGQRQRVGLARAFVTGPKVIFMDEPFSELDTFTAGKLRDDLLAVWQERKPTIIMVSHIIEEAVLLADRIAVLSDRPSRIKKILANDLPRPRNPRSEKVFDLEDKLTALIHA